MLLRVFGCLQPLLLIALALGHHPVGEVGAAVTAPQLHNLERSGLPLDIDPVAVVIELDEDLHGVLIINGDGLQKEGVQLDPGQTPRKLPFAEVFKPDLRAFLGVEQSVALGGGDDSGFGAGSTQIAGKISCPATWRCLAVNPIATRGG